MVVDVSMIVEVMEWPKAMSTSSSWHHHAKGSRAQHVMSWMHQASMTMSDYYVRSIYSLLR